MIHTVKGFGIVNKAEVYVFLEISCFFDDPMDIGNLIYGSSAISKSSLDIWKVRSIRSHHFMVNRWGNNGNSEKLYFLQLQNHCWWWLQSWNLKTFAPWKKSYDQPRQHIKKQRGYFADKGPSSQSYDFSSSHVWMWELDHKESWALKNCGF